MASRRLCPACDGETEHRFLWSKNGSQVFRCSACGLGAAVQEDFNPAAYYDWEYFNSATKGGYPDYLASEQILRAEFRGIVERLRRIVPSGCLLEIGSAYGFFLVEASAHYEVHGVELAGDAAAFARARGLDVRTGSLTRQMLEEVGPVDIIVMLDVIEHLEDPTAMLCHCAEFLRPGGAVVLTTPDFASALARLGGKRWRNMTPPQHLWYFTPDSLGKMAALAGLRVADVAHPWKRVPVSLVLQLIGRCTGRQFPPTLLSSASKVGVAVNLFDSMRIVLRKGPQ
ncbi:MAG TPA: methyltransferase domain-containing protein [Stellaceae bacterium]|nr:methyltransferase domain-containing protein [Stellaceae bacterium]